MTRTALLGALLRASCALGWPLARLDAEAADAPLTGHDADLLAGWRTWEAWRGLVSEIAQPFGWRLVTAIPRGGCLTLFLASGDASEFLQLDLHRALSARGVPFADPDRLFAAARVEDGALRLDAQDALSVRELEHRLATGTARSAHGCVAQVHVHGAFGCLPPTWSSALAVALLRRPGQLLRLAGAKLIDLAGRWLDPPGALWALSGPDGAGKTTLAGALGQVAPRRLAAGIRILHTRPFLWPRPSSPPPADWQERRTGRARSWLRWGLAWLDFRLGYWLLVRPHLAAGRLVLFDRYALDYAVAPRRRGIDLEDDVVRRLVEAVPKPLGTLVLITDPRELVRRKGETTEVEAARQVEAYRTLAGAVPNGLLLDAGDAKPEEVARRALVHLVEVMARRAGPDRP
ncbi:MAG: hypothetical protein HY816_08465 [Candidatus Wallbacteria bacterium]|nr:hypothetical protein [Candidatus Wallbacteria bacterium]